MAEGRAGSQDSGTQGTRRAVRADSVMCWKGCRMDFRLEFERLSGRYYREGALVASESRERRTVLDPATAGVLGSFPYVTADEVDAVVETANRAQREWWTQSALHRAEVMHEVACRLRAVKPDLAELLTRETGKPFKESADEVDWSVTAIYD